MKGLTLTTDAQQSSEGQKADEQQDQQDSTQTKPSWWRSEWDELPDEAQEAIRLASKQAGSEAAKARKRAQAAEAKVAEFERANLSESEQAAQRLKDLETERDQAIKRAKQQSLRAEVVATATKLEFRNPSIAMKMIDLDDIEFDDQDNPTNVADVVAGLLEAEPYLSSKAVKQNASADGGSGRHQQTAETLTMTERIRRAAGKS